MERRCLGPGRGRNAWARAPGLLLVWITEEKGGSMELRRGDIYIYRSMSDQM
ncbi:unnamed protein product [Durusdinium trenchii]|uniref:Uncharacterized protein n=1 Tax=Durusdinium trenchii TaxID=1381693 RepID=A0ABP0R799_9DINO